MTNISFKQKHESVFIPGTSHVKWSTRPLSKIVVASDHCGVLFYKRCQACSLPLPAVMEELLSLLPSKYSGRLIGSGKNNGIFSILRLFIWMENFINFVLHLPFLRILCIFLLIRAGCTRCTPLRWLGYCWYGGNKGDKRAKYARCRYLRAGQSPAIWVFVSWGPLGTSTHWPALTRQT